LRLEADKDGLRIETRLGSIEVLTVRKVKPSDDSRGMSGETRGLSFEVSSLRPQFSGLKSQVSSLRPQVSGVSSSEIGMSKIKDFETALQRLEEIVKKLDSGDLPLASLLEIYEEGVTLSRFCQSKLEEAERKVEILTKKTDGRLAKLPFEEKGEDESP
jgi:exodeoxyribonuclease VII small subunit